LFAAYGGLCRFLLLALQPAAAKPAVKTAYEPPKVVKSLQELHKPIFVGARFIHYVRIYIV